MMGSLDVHIQAGFAPPQDSRIVLIEGTLVQNYLGSVTGTNGWVVDDSDPGELALVYPV
jgi:hypothetical protein